jgi:hypothetical protein
MNVDFHSRHSLSAVGPGASSACACGVSLGRAFPAGVSYLPFQSTLFKNSDETPFIYKQARQCAYLAFSYSGKLLCRSKLVVS